MGRRKKEPKSTHREHIASAASVLFLQKGIAATSMDDIAKAAGYSKATLYVYFENKDEIIGLLVLDSMKKLYDCIASALAQPVSTKERYDLICGGLAAYQEEFPFYFQMALEKINIDLEAAPCLPEEKETYQVGEENNEKLKEFLLAGIENGDLRRDLPVLPTIFALWGMLAGLVQLAANKEAYIAGTMALSKKEFMAYGFQMLYHSIAKENDQ